MPRDVVLQASPTAPPRELTAAGLFADHGAFVWRVLRRLGVPDIDADDACQEVFLTVHRRLHAFEGRSSPRTWLYGICVRVASDYRKRAKTRRERCAPNLPDQAVEPSQLGQVALNEARALLDRILEELDDEKRAAFVLYEIEELSLKEVAVALGCPLQTAFSRLQAARRDVEAALARLRAEEDRHE